MELVTVAAGSQVDWEGLLSLGLNVAAIGMGVVFAVLVLLSGIMVLIGKLGGAAGDGPPKAGSTGTDKIDQAGAGGSAAAAAPDDGPAPGPELAAVIAAAVAATTLTEERLGPAPAGAPPASRRGQLSWVLSGRMEQLTSRERLSRGWGPGKGRRGA